ncbi:MAG: iron oxidase [Polaromonas sp.]|nr:iron oxidase [Polaromonas sp.]
MNKIEPISRRKMILDSSVRGSIIFLPIAIFSASVKAGSSNKAMLHYQEDPKDGQMCSGCAAFTPSAASDEGNGSCKIVGGPVKLRGWCIAFSPR